MTGAYDAGMSIAKPPVVSASEWDSSVAALREQEERLAAVLEETAAARKRMPMVLVEDEYLFEGPEGVVRLVDLFEGRSQLILYRFFFEEGVAGWPDAGCAGCSSWADGVGDLGLVHAHDVTFAMASPAEQSQLAAYKTRMGWDDVPWYTIRTPSFTSDFGATEWFALNVFLRDGDTVYRTYFLQNGTVVGGIGSVNSLLSLTPYGSQMEGEDVPDGWPQAPHAFWMRRHDEYTEPAPSAVTDSSES